MRLKTGEKIFFTAPRAKVLEWPIFVYAYLDSIVITNKRVFSKGIPIVSLFVPTLDISLGEIISFEESSHMEYPINYLNVTKITYVRHGVKHEIKVSFYDEKVQDRFHANLTKCVHLVTKTS